MRVFVLVLLCLLATAPAHAARFSLMGAANSSQPHEPGVQYSAKPAYGGGVLLEMGLVPFLGFEIGALVMPRSYEMKALLPTESTRRYTGKNYHFPLLLRMHLGRLLSFGLGGYFTRAEGGLSEETTTGGSSSSQGITYASRQQTTTDYGALASLGLYFRLVPLTYLAFDARYAMGMKNNSTVAGSDRKFNDMQLLAGIQFVF